MTGGGASAPPPVPVPTMPSPATPRPELYDVDFARSPFLAIWEVTRACDLACKHCRAEAIARRDPRELTPTEGLALLEQIAGFGQPVVVLTGGDPIKRPDIYDLLRHGTSLGLRMTMTPSGTPLMTPEVVARCQEAGLRRLAVSLDGASATVHDSFRQVAGSFDWSVRMLVEARRIGLSTQINSTVTRQTLGELEGLRDLVADLEVSLWSVFFLVPVGRGRPQDEVSADEYEAVFEKLAAWAARGPFDLKSTAAPHYRRYLMQQRVKAARLRREVVRGGPSSPERAVPEAAAGGGIERAPRAVNDGNGLVFVSHTGDIYPSGFLPLSAGNVRKDSLVEVYRSHPLFVGLRDYTGLKGKCGVCEFRNVCGGSRARAWAMSGDPMESEPFCAYVPAPYRKLVEAGEALDPAAYFAAWARR